MKRRLKIEIGRLKRQKRSPFLTSHFSLLTSRRGFSLVEMMIAIVILGLGLIMVATMFPVAWDRARKLNERSLSPNVTANARINLSSLLRSAGLAHVAPKPPSQPDWVLGYGSFAGDLLYDPTLLSKDPNNYYLNYKSIISFSDSRVHALNAENLLIVPNANGTIARENPWRIERLSDFCLDPDLLPWGALVSPPGDPTYAKRQHDIACGTTIPTTPPDHEGGTLFFSPQIKFEQRVHPSLPALPNPNDPNYAALKAQWDATLATRRFGWGILHRLRPRAEKIPDRLCPPIGPSTPGTNCPLPNPPFPPGTLFPPKNTPQGIDQSIYLSNEAAMAMGSARNFDIYYVMLRRPSPTYRFAQQDSSDLTHVPNPDDRGAAPIVPAAQSGQNDVAFPVPWRVQVEFPSDRNPPAQRLPSAFDPARSQPNGSPTEITVPPQGMVGGPDVKLMVINMFPQGTQFVDEITGVVYRVVKQRIAATGDSATLTLDKEVLAEDIDDGANYRMPGNPSMTIKLEDDATVRTVWVYPPSVEPGRADGSPPTFSGGSPVVSIEVDGLTFTPTP